MNPNKINIDLNRTPEKSQQLRTLLNWANVKLFPLWLFFPKLSFVHTERYFLVPSIMKLITYSFSILQCNKYDNTTHDICSQTFRKLFLFLIFQNIGIYFLFRLQLQIILLLSENPILFKMTKYHHMIWIYSKNLIPC